MADEQSFERLVIYEDCKKITIWLRILGVLVLLPVGLVLVSVFWRISINGISPSFGSLAKQIFWPIVVLIFLGALIIACERHFSRRSKAPYLIFTKEGLLYADLIVPVPWSQIRGFELANGFAISKLPLDAELPGLEQLSWDANIGSFRLVAHLQEGYKMQLRDDRLKSFAYSVKRVWYHPEGHWLIFKPLSVRGMSNQQLLDYFNTFWRRGVARTRVWARSRP